ncbi:TATA-box-binding protein-like [Mastacembelus armatus]|uniref:TATA-box-binding protein-like n=1 Tax=Mastacembelus armatus TaxID=205130 RepID=UPI001436A215|nr:TATA-box-binding protein-like [Mastacembelus armatus]
MEEQEEVREELEEELFLRLLPDELLTLFSPNATDETRQTTAKESRAVSTNLDYSSQNATAVAELPGGQGAFSTGPRSLVSTELPKITPKIINIIATVTLGCGLDLDLIARKAWNVQYNPKSYKALFMRLRDPQTTAVIYTSGNIVCTGATSEQDSRVATRRFARILQKLGFPVSFLDFKIQNVVARCSSFPVSLEGLAMAHRWRCSYEPEMFPGLLFNVMPGITLTIFASGNMSLTGAKSEAQVYEVLDTISPILSCFRRL